MTNWFFRKKDRYDTRGASCRLTPSGWVLFWMSRERIRARGPFLSLDDAMDAWPAIQKSLDTACSV
jgi:hypothetical protein